ncbi:MAG: hypothetical protein DWI57_03295 [Chloroflexi bacterium]|nr:MAG: hypothetical protein DWI57_03295 [Chloroflexota bacterium]
MQIQTEVYPPGFERTILTILRHLPPERGQQLLTFARFLAFETFQTTELDFLDDETEETDNDARWDALLASDVGQNALDRLADEALAAIRAGESRPIAFGADGEIVPR